VTPTEGLRTQGNRPFPAQKADQTFKFTKRLKDMDNESLKDYILPSHRPCHRLLFDFEGAPQQRWEIMGHEQLEQNALEVTRHNKQYASTEISRTLTCFPKEVSIRYHYTQGTLLQVG
jgi:hypothetical protein